MRPVRALVLPLVLPLLLASTAACAKEAPGYEGPYRRQVRAAIPRIEESIGLPFKTLPVLEERSRDEVREFVVAQFQEQVTPIEMAGLQQAYRLFGLLPDTLDLQTFMVELLTEQIAGYYDPAKKVLYVVRDAPANQRDMVIAHELVHALQDQHTSLDSTRALKGDNDRMVAMHAVVEGQATYEQLLSQTGGTDLDLMVPSSWDVVRESIRAAQSSMPKFASAPTYIQETAIFPYLSGAAFMREFKRARGGRSPYQPFASSTEQILHPERYLSATPDVPTRVTLAAPRAGSVLYEDNLGEFEIRLFLYEHLRDLNTAVAAADGWDGDRFQLVSASGGAALGWVTVWDDPIQAAQFREALQRLIERRYRLPPRSGGEGDISRWTARGRRFLVESATFGGRAVVIYEDAPAASTARLITSDRVALREP